MTIPTYEIQNWEKGSWLVNHPHDLITHDATERFIASIQEARREGYGFVPFVGAGFSAPSGAPLVHELGLYLQRCICMTLGAEEPGMEAWDPQTDQWPPFIDRSRTEKTIFKRDYWMNRIREELWNPTRTQSEYSVMAQGWGAAVDWRTALLFLSRLVRDPRGTGERRPQPVSLAAPQQEIIDSCLREVLKEKYPSLGHKMLAALAGALRLDIVLTTNFDDLLERAFAGARNPLEVFEVHLNSNLPHWSAVSDVRSLIKLHGNRYSLRADYSLDELPSETDKRRFLEYLLSGKGRSDLARNTKAVGLDFQNHLLVMGYSGNDCRTRAFIEHAWQRLHKDFRVFWLCYSNRDVTEAQKFTKNFFEESKGGDPDEQRHSIILRHTDFGFFLLQLYQTIRKNLPPLGSLFPSVSRLTLPPMPSPYTEKQRAESLEIKSFRGEILRYLKSFQDPGYSRLKLLVATADSDARGVTTACGEIYRELESSNVCLWMDMNDISSTDNLFEVLLEAASFRLGLENWLPVFIASDTRPRGDEIRRLVQSVAKPWIIFLNARETPGANTTDEKDPSPNGWLDASVSRNVADPSACMGKFVELLRELCKEDSKAMSVVLLCRNSPTEPSPLVKELKDNGFGWHVNITPYAKEQVDFSEEAVTARAIVWTAGNRHRQRFLHAMVLMQRPRLLATIWSSALALHDDLSMGSSEDRTIWVNDLEKIGLLRRKAGGFIWIHSRSRQFIRAILGNKEGQQGKFLNRYPDAQAAWGDWEPESSESEIHERLSEWYVKVLDASESPAAVFEAVYHLCRAAETAKGLTEGQTERACQMVEAAAALLKSNGFLIQTQWYSRGSCRHLEYIRDTLCTIIRGKLDSDCAELFDATQRLRIVCTEVMRMVAREVGEDAKLYLRHRQLGVLLAGGEWTPEMETKCKKAKGAEERYYVSQELHKKFVARAVLGGGDEPRRAAGEKYVSNPAAEWLRWWRWSGMLGIASRSFPVAKRALEKALRYAVQDNDAYDTSMENINWDRLIQGDYTVFGRSLSGSRVQEIRIEVLRIVEQYVALLLLEDVLFYRLNAFEEWRGQGRRSALRRSEKARKSIDIIKKHIDFGLKLAAEIRNRDHSSDSHSTISANWCEGRLLMHKSVCASRLVQLDHSSESEVPQNAMALLGDVEAGLRISDPRRRRSELSMIELHRADARLRQAESVQIYEGVEKNSMSFAQMYRALEIWPLEDNINRGEELLTKFLGEDDKWEADVHKALRRAKSLVTDSLRFLNRAEPVLRARRRNVWWTTWFFERRLRAVALSVWASVFEFATPIPFLGLEAAMRKTDTIADTLLKDAIRMIRVDAYRLATIIDAYASCAKALHTRLICAKVLYHRLNQRHKPSPPRPVPLNERQKAMNAELGKALIALSAVEKQRNKLDSVAWKAHGCMSTDVVSYVRNVQRRVALIAEQVKDPIGIE